MIDFKTFKKDFTKKRNHKFKKCSRKSFFNELSIFIENCDVKIDCFEKDSNFFFTKQTYLILNFIFSKQNNMLHFRVQCTS